MKNVEAQRERNEKSELEFSTSNDHRQLIAERTN